MRVVLRSADGTHVLDERDFGGGESRGPSSPSFTPTAHFSPDLVGRRKDSLGSGTFLWTKTDPRELGSDNKTGRNESDFPWVSGRPAALVVQEVLEVRSRPGRSVPYTEG